MGTSVEHDRYVVAIIQDVEWEGDLRGSEEAWWEAPVATCQPGMPLYAVPLGARVVPAVVLYPDLSIHEVHRFFETHIESFLSGFLEGGLAVIDLDSLAVLRMNWDVGETEEWRVILDGISNGRRVTHTFAATDAVVEVWRDGDTIDLQLLDWEAIPNGLETSRLHEPIHVFKDADLFVQQVSSCLKWLHSLQVEIADSSSPFRDQLLQLLSTAGRRHG